MDFAGVEIREKLDMLQLPLEADRPIILRFDPSLDPIVRLALVERRDNTANPDSVPVVRASQTNAFDEELLKFQRRYADEEVKKDLESVLGVAAVKVSGGLEDEIQVYVDQSRLSQLNLPIEDVANLLRAESVNLSGGRLEEGTQQYLVRTDRLKSVETVRPTSRWPARSWVG